jgi:hypothetical protein
MGRALLHLWLSFRMELRHCTDAFGPDSWTRGREWLHKYHTVDTISQCRLLPGANSKYLLWILFRVLLTPKWPPDGPLCSSVSMSFILLRGRIIWAIRDCPSVNSQLRSSMPFLTASDFHWAQQPLYVGLRLAISFRSSHCPAFTWVAGSQLAAATAAIDYTRLTSAHASTLQQWVHSSWQGHCERASALLCFWPWRCSEV